MADASYGRVATILSMYTWRHGTWRHRKMKDFLARKICKS